MKVKKKKSGRSNTGLVCLICGSPYWEKNQPDYQQNWGLSEKRGLSEQWVLIFTHGSRCLQNWLSEVRSPFGAPHDSGIFCGMGPSAPGQKEQPFSHTWGLLCALRRAMVRHAHAALCPSPRTTSLSHAPLPTATTATAGWCSWTPSVRKRCLWATSKSLRYEPTAALLLQFHLYCLQIINKYIYYKYNLCVTLNYKKCFQLFFSFSLRIVNPFFISVVKLYRTNCGFIK